MPNDNILVCRRHIEVILAELQFMRDLPGYVLFYGRKNRLTFVCSILEEYIAASRTVSRS